MSNLALLFVGAFAIETLFDRVKTTENWRRVDVRQIRSKQGRNMFPHFSLRVIEQFRPFRRPLVITTS